MVENLKAEEAEWALKVQGRNDLTALKKHLLAKGGSRFQRNSHLAAECDANATAYLIKCGQFFHGKGALLKRMNISDCHQNSARLALKAGIEWWTGLALSKDGIWRIHSWCVKGAKIIETTEPRTLYFGVPLVARLV